MRAGLFVVEWGGVGRGGSAPAGLRGAPGQQGSGEDWRDPAAERQRLVRPPGGALLLALPGVPLQMEAGTRGCSRHLWRALRGSSESE